MRKVILIIAVLIFTAHSNSQGWVQQTSSINSNFNEVQFINENTGFIAAGFPFNNPGHILKTMNGGASWAVSLNTSYQLQTIFFIDQLTGFTSGYTSYVTKTINSGVSWFTVNQSYNNRSKLYFLNPSTGYAITSFPFLIYTNNGGSSWSSYNNIFCTDCSFYDVWFINTNTGFLLGWNRSYKTTNAGVNWDYLFDEKKCISFKDTVNGIIGGPQRTIVKTTNSGLNWIQVYSNGTYSDYILDIQYIDNSNIIAVGTGGFIVRSTNGGIDWLQQASTTTKRLTGVSFVNPNTGWVVGDTGLILKTTNGGITSLEPIISKVPEKYSLFQNYPNPFNPTTKIRFEIPLSRGVSGAAGRGVSLVIYDILGREIATLVNEQLKPGTYEVKWNASNNPSGVYFYKLTAGDFSETKKMVLIK